MRLITAILFSALAFSPALADSSQGDGAWMPMADDGYVLNYVEPVATFQTIQHSTAATPSAPTTQAQLDAEVARLRALRRQAYAGKTCNSDFLAVDQKAFCLDVNGSGGAGNVGTFSPNPTGGSVGATLGSGD